MAYKDETQLISSGSLQGGRAVEASFLCDTKMSTSLIILQYNAEALCGEIPLHDLVYKKPYSSNQQTTRHCKLQLSYQLKLFSRA